MDKEVFRAIQESRPDLLVIDERKIISNPRGLEISDIKFWCHDQDQETFYSETIKEAIEEYQEHVKNDLESKAWDKGRKILTLYGFVPKRIDTLELSAAVGEYIQDFINENYMGEDGHELTVSDLAIIKNTCEEISTEVKVWQQEEVMIIEIPFEEVEGD